MYYNCVTFHKNPISRLGGVALTRYMDGRTDGQDESYIPTDFACGGIINSYSTRKIKGHISKTDKAVKSEIEFDIPMITDLVYTFQIIC